MAALPAPPPRRVSACGSLIVGGKLQGTEAVYLAAKAGWETVLVDRREAPPAAGLADVARDRRRDRRRGAHAQPRHACDAVLPACEDEPTLAWLAERVPAWDVPLLFDLDAYRVTRVQAGVAASCSRELDVPRPGDWPACGFPVVVKPSDGQRQRGRGRRRTTRRELDAARRDAGARRSRGRGRGVRGRSVALARGALPGAAAPSRCRSPVSSSTRPTTAGASSRRSARPRPARPRAGGADGACDWEAAVAPGVLAALDDAGVRIAAGPRAATASWTSR